jgi:hypothetical protein
MSRNQKEFSQLFLPKALSVHHLPMHINAIQAAVDDGYK